MVIGTWNVRSWFKLGAMKETITEIRKYKIDICGLQEIRWKGNGILQKKDETIYYSGNNTARTEFGTGFYVSKRIQDKIIL